MSVKAIPLAAAIAERQPPTHWRPDKNSRPRISYRAAMCSWLSFPSGMRWPVQSCLPGVFRSFIETCLAQSEIKEIAHLSEIHALLDGPYSDLDDFARWFILGALLAAGVLDYDPQGGQIGAKLKVETEA